MAPICEVEHMPFWQEWQPRIQNSAIDGVIPESKSALHKLTKIPLNSDKYLDHLVSDLYEDYKIQGEDSAASFGSGGIEIPAFGTEVHWVETAAFKPEIEIADAETLVQVTNISIQVQIFEALNVTPSSQSSDLCCIKPPSTTAGALYFLQCVLIQNNRLYELVKNMLDNMRGLNEANIKILQDLKEAITNYTSAIDASIQEYVFMSEGARTLREVEWVEILKRKHEMMEIVNSLNPECLPKLVPSASHLTSEHILCSIVGVSSECADWMMAMSEDIRGHQSAQYWILRYIEDMSHVREDERSESPECAQESSSREELIAYGFTPARAEIIQSAIENMDGVRSRQTLLYWAQTYVNQKFSYDILLNDSPRYPYSPEVCQQWYTALVSNEERLWDQEDEEDPTFHSLNMINLKGFNDHSFKERNGTEYPPTSDDDHLVFFHATDHNSATSILEQGILPKKGQEGQDFSGTMRGGFYMASDVDTAISHARNTRFTPKGAMIVFKVPRDKFLSYNRLDLCDDHEKWGDVVSYNRTDGKWRLSKELRKVLDRVDFIEGPMCATIPGKSGFRPVGIIGRDNLKQTCLLSEEVADFVGDMRHIDGVIFFNSS